MDMRLHKKVEDFTDLIRITSEYIGLDPKKFASVMK